MKLNNMQALIQMQKRKGDMLINLWYSNFYDIWESSFFDTFFLESELSLGLFAETDVSC